MIYSTNFVNTNTGVSDALPRQSRQATLLIKHQQLFTQTSSTQLIMFKSFSHIRGNLRDSINMYDHTHNHMRRHSYLHRRHLSANRKCMDDAFWENVLLQSIPLYLYIYSRYSGTCLACKVLSNTYIHVPQDAFLSYIHCQVPLSVWVLFDKTICLSFTQMTLFLYIQMNQSTRSLISMF